MKNNRSLIFGIVSSFGLVALGWPVPSPGQPVAPAGASQSPGCKVYDLNQPLTSALMTSGMLLPCAPRVSTGGRFANIIDNLQHGFDRYSWLTFVALNSPADGVTPIGKGPGSGKDARVIWETYKQLPDLMLEDGKNPGDWETRHVPDVCKSIDAPGRMVIHIEEETFNQPFKSGPVIDQDGNYALFIILVNKEMFEFIKGMELYSKAKQKEFAGTIDFSFGTNGGGTPPKSPALGAVMLKVSFKVMGKNDKPEQFHILDALVYTPEKKIRSGTRLVSSPSSGWWASMSDIRRNLPRNGSGPVSSTLTTYPITPMPSPIAIC